MVGNGMAQYKIYLAEDTPVQAELMKAALHGIVGYEPYFFSDGLELYRKVLEEPPDMLVLDIILPSLSGLVIARLLKFHDQYKHIPILVVSSITDPDIKDQALSAGADRFLSKPYKIQDFLTEIAALVNK
jgi:CheY-like chemotaxis protein